MALIDDILSGAIGGFGSAPAYTPATPPAAATPDPAPPATGSAPLWAPPSLDSFTTKEEAAAAQRKALSLLPEYRKQIQLIENALKNEGYYYSNGRWVRQAGGSKPPTYDYDAGTQTTKYFDASGKPISQQQYQTQMAAHEAGGGGGVEVLPFTDNSVRAWQEASNNYGDLSDYATSVNAVQADLPSAPKPAVPEKPEEMAPVKIGVDQFMAAISGQESSGRAPTWATAPITQGFGPTDEPLDSGYNGYAHFNKGYDYGIPVGTPIDATVGGTVVSVGDVGDGWGVRVQVRDSKGYTHNYGHLSAANVEVGQQVAPGQVVGASGNTGASTGPHLSYDVWNSNGEYVDPRPWITGGNYDAVNKDSGAHGAFQIMPENWAPWAEEAGLGADAERTPENQAYVARYKMGQYYDQTGDWGKVARMWYAGPGSLNYSEEALNRKQGPNGEYPSINEYVNGIMQKLGDYALSVTQGTVTPNGVRITGGNTSSGGGGGGSSSPPKKPDPLKDYLESGAYGLEVQRGAQSDRAYTNAAQAAKDYLTILNAANTATSASTKDYMAYLDAVNGLVADEAALKKLSGVMNNEANATAAQVNAAVEAGKLSYWNEMAGPQWSDPLAPLYDKLQKPPEYKPLQEAPEGFVDQWLSAVPKNVPKHYSLNAALGLPEEQVEYWSPTGFTRFAEGTTSQYPGVDWRDVPYIALYNSGKNVPSGILQRLVQAGAIKGDEPEDVVDPYAAYGGYKPGYVPINSTLPPPLRQYDVNEWLDQATEGMAANISAGRTSLPASWGITGLERWAGTPASQMPASFITMLRGIISTHRNTPEIIQEFGAAPSSQTTWVPDPNAPPPEPEEPAGRPTSTGVNPRANMGYQSYNGGGGGGSQYSGVYGGGMDAAEQARIELQKQQLAMQQGIADAQMKLDRERFELEKIQDTRSAEYLEKNYQIELLDQSIRQSQLALQQTQSQLAQSQFEEALRAAQYQEYVTGQRLDMDRVKQAADLAYQEEQLELARQAGALNQAEYEERKRQFDTNFEYQKSKDERAQNLERARITAEVMTKPYDAVAQQFKAASMKAPVGEAFDLFTGTSRGTKTYDEAYAEDAELYKQSMRPTKMFAEGGYTNDSHIIGGDKRVDSATGNEEFVYNPTGAPLMILSNEVSQALGIVPKKGKPFGAHVQKGVA